MHRRDFLATVARAMPAAGVAACLPSLSLAQQAVSKDRLIVRSARPEDLETPVELLTSWITPTDLFYVRSHFYTPVVDETAWRLRVDGEVENALDLTLADLRRLPRVTSVATLECAGNGRAFFNPPVAGIQWEKGAVGTASWTGVRLADVLRQARARGSVQYVWLDGADVGVGRAPDFVRSVPIDKAMNADTLLVYEMNGQPLPASHGFPLRAIVPGWEGAYSVKWLTHIQASATNHDGAFVQAGYRFPRRPVAPGTVVPASETDPLRSLPVKSLITSPAANATVQGQVRVTGFAWVGEGAIRRVDVSTDGGRTWSSARLGANQARHAWREFEYVWRPQGPGSHVLLSRATDNRGIMQPVVAEWNPAGYSWNAVDQVRVNVAP